MTLLFYAILAMAGAAALGFLSAWFWQRHHIGVGKKKLHDLTTDLEGEKFASDRLKAEIERQKLSIENLQKLMQNLENQCFELEHRLKKSEFNAQVLTDEKHRLMVELDALIKENEAIREMPKLDFDVEVEEGEEGEMNLRTKAKKLVKAFRKGYQELDSPPASNS